MNRFMDMSSGHLDAKQLLVAAVAVFLLAFTMQPPEAAAQVPAKSTTPNASAVGSISWTGLNAAQKEALAPLATVWPSLTDGQQRKWLSIAQTYPKLGPAEREKMQHRMLDWAALNPKDREQARLNFSQTKTIPPADRAANWEAYQALSPEEKQKLATKAEPKPAGAAASVKPVPPSKLAQVPVTRHTPDEKRSEQGVKRPLDRNTLLPKPPADKPDPAKL